MKAGNGPILIGVVFRADLKHINGIIIPLVFFCTDKVKVINKRVEVMDMNPGISVDAKDIVTHKNDKGRSEIYIRFRVGLTA